MNTKSKLTLGLAALAVAMVGMVGAAQAQAQTQAKTLNIAVLDNQKVLSSVNAIKRANADISAKSKAAQARIDALEKPLVEKKQKLIAQQGVLSAEKFQQASSEFGKEIDTLRQQTQKIESELNQQITQIRSRIFEVVGTAVEQIAKEKGYDLIVPKGMTVFTSSNVPDITADTLARANSMLDK